MSDKGRSEAENATDAGHPEWSPAAEVVRA